MEKEYITQVSIKSNTKNWNPIFNTMKVGIEDEGAGTFLKIIGEDEHNDGQSLSIDWDEWDAIVEVVSKYRKVWE